MKGQLARLTKLIEGHTRIMPENIHGSTSFPLQSSSYPLVRHPYPNHEPYIPVVNVLPRVHRLNWQPHTPTSAIISAFEKMLDMLIKQVVQGIISKSQGRIQTRIDGIPVPSPTLNYFPGC